MLVWLSPHAKRHARLGKSQLRADDMDDALVHAVEAEKFDAELCDVSFQRLSEIFRLFVEKRPLAHVGGNDMVDGGKRAIAKRHVHAVFSQHVERRRRGDLVNQMQPDKKLCLARR